MARLLGLNSATRLLQAIAVILAVLISGYTLYVKYRIVEPISSPIGLKVIGNREQAVNIFRAEGGSAKVQLEDFPATSILRRGQSAFVAIALTKNHQRCKSVKANIELEDDLGLLIPISEIDMSNVNAPVGYSLLLAPIIIPQDMATGAYRVGLDVTYLCGGLNQVISWPKTNVTIGG